MSDQKKEFFKRADEHINLSNKQLADANVQDVGASMMYSTARFNAWIIAGGFASSEELKEKKATAIQYFVGEYEKMLKENIENYIENFDQLMK